VLEAVDGYKYKYMMVSGELFGLSLFKGVCKKLQIDHIGLVVK